MYLLKVSIYEGMNPVPCWPRDSGMVLEDKIVGGGVLTTYKIKKDNVKEWSPRIE